MGKREDAEKLLNDIGIKDGDKAIIEFDSIPTPMMEEFGGSMSWAEKIRRHRGMSFFIRNPGVRNGIPYVEAKGFGYIIPLDCLNVYYNVGLEVDEAVEFY